MFGLQEIQLLLLGCLTVTASGTATPQNANHIFNAIHSSMRQWGSSLNHNGMSFFLATVPEGTQFYHGTPTPYPVNGSEWLAFEPEHAMGFARPRGVGPHRRKKPGQGSLKSKSLGGRDAGQHSLQIAPEDSTVNAGYLHTYTTARNLRLLYLDGMAAAKSSIGTLDSHDRILLNDSLAGGGERERADIACKMADDIWEGRIDGILRMEAGFEIILCHFERDLEVTRITQTKAVEWNGGPGPRANDSDSKPGSPGKGMGGSGNSWTRAVAARYHSIGGHRVSLNFDNFVTAFTYDLDLFAKDPEKPRLTHLSTQELEPIRQDLHNLIITQDFPEPSSFDWQAVADMIVTRYSDELQNLANGNFTSTTEISQRTERMLGMFIDYSDPNNTEAITDRCADQFIPKRAPKEGLAFLAVHSISKSICFTLTAAMCTEDVEDTKASFQDLIDYLSWTSWKECRGCAYNELCVIPMWPMGNLEDYEHPRCQSGPPEDQGKSYWGPREYGPGGRP